MHAAAPMAYSTAADQEHARSGAATEDFAIIENDANGADQAQRHGARHGGGAINLQPRQADGCRSGHIEQGAHRFWRNGPEVHILQVDARRHAQASHAVPAPLAGQRNAQVKGFPQRYRIVTVAIAGAA